MGTHGALWLFAAICIVGLFFVIFFVPETKGKSLEEIERAVTGRRTSGVANMKPMPSTM